LGFRGGTVGLDCNAAAATVAQASGTRKFERAVFGKPGAQSRDEQDRLGARHDAAQHYWFMGFLDRFFGGI